MIRQIFLTQSGIQFEADKLHSIGLDPKTLYPTVLPRPPPLPVPRELACDENGEILRCDSCDIYTQRPRTQSGGSSDDGTAYEVTEGEEEAEHDGLLEEHAELHDALSPIYDQLVRKWMWWILEFLPLVHTVQNPDGTFMKVIS